MAKTKVKLKLDPKLTGRELFGKRFQERLGLQVVMAMRENIAIGLSPVRGVGRFVGYAAQRKANEVKSFASTQEKSKQGFYRKMARKTLKNSSQYPNSVKNKYPDKQLRPVNLYLDGSFLETISYQAADGIVEIGHIDPDQKTRQLFEAHNEGLNPNVPKRKYLPNKRGDEFIVTIMRMIKSVYQERIKQILKRSK